MLSYRTYMKSRFGGAVMKIPVSAGLSCPNRDGTKSSDGCVFCDNRAFSPAHDSDIPPVDQVRNAINKCAGRYKLFLPYLQPYSNTYAPLDKLRSIYEPLLDIDGVVGLAIGTRPDCVSSEVCDYLGELNGRTYISLELGLQSGHDEILKKMNRGHTVRDFIDAVHRLAKYNIETVAHIILGFPGETDDMVAQTAKMLSSLPVRGVKIHQLMIIENTPLAEMYRSGDLPEISLERYADLLALFISNLRPDMHIHRLAADSKPEYGLIAPLWSARKAETVDYLKKRLGVLAASK